MMDFLVTPMLKAAVLGGVTSAEDSAESI